MNIVCLGKAAQATAIAFRASWFNRQVKFVTSLRQVVEIAAVDVPGQNEQSSHG